MFPRLSVLLFKNSLSTNKIKSKIEKTVESIPMENQAVIKPALRQTDKIMNRIGGNFRKQLRFHIEKTVESIYGLF